MKKEKNNKINQRSFYFQDYNYNSVVKNKNEKLAVNQDRVYLLFFVFFCLIFIFATKIFFISLKNLDSKNYVKNYPIFKPLRNDILDRNGDPIARNVVVYHAAIKPNLIKDKKKFIIKLKLLYPELNFQFVKRNLEKNKYFYLKKNISKEEYYSLLGRSKAVVSYALQENFGFGVAEAVYLGCTPVLPNRLVYPELYPDIKLFDRFDESVEMVIEAINNYQEQQIVLYTEQVMQIWFGEGNNE